MDPLFRLTHPSLWLPLGLPPWLPKWLPQAGWALAGLAGILLGRERAHRSRVAAQALGAEAARKGLEAQLVEGRRLEGVSLLTAGLVHDLNHLLAVIRHHAECLKGRPPDGGEPSREAILSGCARALGMTRSLLRMARRGGEGGDPVDLNEVVADTLRLLAPGPLKGVAVLLDLQEALPRVQGDAGALGNAFMNICLNAADASEPGDPLRVRTWVDPGGQVCLSVRDQGCGMEAEVVRRALEPFFTTKPPGRGTGLGLSMVAGILADHGGTLSLTSRPGSGTEVLLALPACAAPEPAPLPPAPGPGVLRILVVDDDADLRSALCPLLASLGHRVLEAAGGREALRLFQEGLEVDLVLLDVEMPGLGGHQTLQALQVLRPGLPVLLASGHDEAEVVAGLPAQARVAAIQKPFSMERFQARAQGLMGRPDA